VQRSDHHRRYGNLVVTLEYNPNRRAPDLLPGETAVRTIDSGSGGVYYAYWFVRYSTVIGATHTYSVTADADNATAVST
jgi:hypothetical protein